MRRVTKIITTDDGRVDEEAVASTNGAWMKWGMQMASRVTTGRKITLKRKIQPFPVWEIHWIRDIKLIN